MKSEIEKKCIIILCLLFAGDVFLNVRAFSASSSSSIASCPPPRFDVFSNQLLGNWWSTDDDDGTRTGTTPVEEVMRSCGGAVQGLRDVNGRYLNRADDGFVYHTDGSYTQGPTEFFETALLFTVQCSISLDTTFRVLACLDVGDNHQVAAATLTELHRDRPSRPVEMVDEPAQVDWYREVRCRMASSSQTWLLQRAKWEELKKAPTEISPHHVVSVSSTNHDDNDDTKTSDCCCSGWIFVGETKEPDGHLICIEVYDYSSRSARGVLRQYNNQNQLCEVSFLDGAIL